MTKVVQITEVEICVGLSDRYKECVDSIKLLQQNNIPVNIHSYPDDKIHPIILASNQFPWIQVTEFPMILWVEKDEDGNVWRRIVHSFYELQTSSLIKNKDLVCRI